MVVHVQSVNSSGTVHDGSTDGPWWHRVVRWKFHGGAWWSMESPWWFHGQSVVVDGQSMVVHGGP